VSVTGEDDAPPRIGQAGRPIGTPFQQSLGVSWAALDDGEDPDAVAIELALRPELCGPAGSLEGGVVSTLVDVAGASAAARALGRMVATQHIAVSFVAPGRVGPVRAVGTPVRVGRNDAVVEVKVTDLGHDASDDGRLMAVALVTVRAFGELRSASADGT